MSTEHTKIEDELPVLDVSWCPRLLSSDGLFMILDERPLEEEIVEEPDTRLAETLGANLLEKELIDEALQARVAGAAALTEKSIRRPYVFGKLVPAGRTPEGELIAVSFELTMWSDPLQHRQVGEPHPCGMIEFRWRAYVCAPEHYEAVKQSFAAEISEYQDNVKVAYDSEQLRELFCPACGLETTIVAHNNVGNGLEPEEAKASPELIKYGAMCMRCMGERQTYLEMIHPSPEAALDYWRDHPEAIRQRMHEPE